MYSLLGQILLVSYIDVGFAVGKGVILGTGDGTAEGTLEGLQQ